MRIGQQVKITDPITGYAGCVGTYLGKSLLGYYQVRLGKKEDNTLYIALVTACEAIPAGV